MDDFKEVEVEPMEKVSQCKIMGRRNGNNLLGKEVTTLKVAILVTLGIIMVEKEK